MKPMLPLPHVTAPATSSTPFYTIAQQQQQQAIKAKLIGSRLDDQTRVNKLLKVFYSERNYLIIYSLSHSLKEVTMRTGQNDLELTIEDAARQVLMEYANEMACTVLEEACLLAKHRGSKKLETTDVSLVLAKKFGIEVPKYERVKKLRKHLYKVTGTAMSSKETGKLEEKEVEGSTRSGLKRKLDS